jgi:hypothetical protein
MRNSPPTESSRRPQIAPSSMRDHLMAQHHSGRYGHIALASAQLLTIFAPLKNAVA